MSDENRPLKPAHIALLAISYLLISYIFFGRYSDGFFFLADDWLYFDTTRGSWKTLWYLPGLGLFWRPLHVILLQGINALFSLKPMPQYIFSLLVHVFNSLLVTVLVKRLTSSRGAALISGTLFSIFYASYEPLFWISARSHMLAAAFILTAACLLSRYIETSSKRYFYLFHAAATAALLSHEFGLTLPVVATIVFFMNPEKHHSSAEGRRAEALRAVKTLAGVYILAGAWFMAEYMYPRLFYSGASGFITTIERRRNITLGAIELLFRKNFFYWIDINGWWLLIIGLFIVFCFTVFFIRLRRQGLLFLLLGVFLMFFLAPGRAARFFYVPAIAISAFYGIAINEAASRILVPIGRLLKDETLKKILYFVFICALMYPFVLTDYFFIKARAGEFNYASSLSKTVFNTTGKVMEKLKDTKEIGIYYINPPVLFIRTPFPPVFISGEYEINSMVKAAFSSNRMVRTSRVHFLGPHPEGSSLSGIGKGLVARYPYVTEYRFFGDSALGWAEFNPEQFDRLTQSSDENLVILFTPDGAAVNVSGMGFDSVRKGFFGKYLSAVR
ncbi:MAG: glycosyltransferase family 39 protein [Deltaproteobacteria bacterium]|nr:glycosyltransferase family 39 protein [Deltaproteobacteria bacterium]